MRFSQLVFSVTLAAATVSAGVVVDRRAAFTLQNGKDAQALNKKFQTLTPTSACTSGEVACVHGQLAQCVNGKFALTSCASTLQCVALPLVNKPGTSVTCDTKQDAEARIANTGATGGLVRKSDLEERNVEAGNQKVDNNSTSTEQKKHKKHKHKSHANSTSTSKHTKHKSHTNSTSTSNHKSHINKASASNQTAPAACKAKGKREDVTRFDSDEKLWRRAAQKDLSQVAKSWHDLCEQSGVTLDPKNNPCVVLGGHNGIQALLARADACAQQVNADAMIDFAKQPGVKNSQALIANAIAYRKHPRNALNQHGVTPSTLFCEQAPRNPELQGIVNAQLPGVDPGLFGSPTAGIVAFGAPGTCPFGQKADVATCTCS
ncbi:hypothetical protein F5148DRAFT_735341 [Russula earlei]|uniref:Uncharacterized protein n=1 Tax=Russula earlei TaxID=71964 RepID=A0ACC0UEX0_9AGAM|nr:hypothetical protein F5148DRAFT_735341 [Russula earlei]